jgi:hypothetical protein
MKKGFTISLNIVLLLFLTVTSNTPMWACGKSKTQKEAQHSMAKCQKSCCKKHQAGTVANCKSACCDKKTTQSSHQKKGCCGDGGCSCSVSTTVSADLPKLALPQISIQSPVLNRKTNFLYKQVHIKSSINSIWQPPISVLSI